MGGSTALQLSSEITDSIDKIILLSPAGLFGEPKSIPFPLNQIGASFLGLQQVRKSLCRQAFAFQMNVLVKWKSKLLQFIRL